MQKALQALAALVAVVAVGTWLATGAHRGWTRNSVEVVTVDEVTGLEGRSYEKKFVAGIELLGAGLLVAGGLAGSSFLFRKRKNQKPLSV